MTVALVHGRDGDAQLATDRPGPEGAIDTALHAELGARGIAFERPCWNDASVDWSRFELAIVRTTWDYTADRDGFVAWAEATARLVPLENPADVLRWNTHKSYLLELEERGAPIVPTAWLAQGDRADLAALCAARGWDEVVVKPAVAAGSDGVSRVAVGAAARRRGQEALDALLTQGDAMVQPFRSRITEGELSLVAIDGRITHAVRKRPSDGEYRVQGQFGGRYARETPSADALALGEWVLDTLGTRLLYARVDLVPADDGTLEVGEVEATEPDLYLELSREGTTALVDAIEHRLRGADRDQA
jgi:glutathione synthase/RimK-type ligase-like ATP-grasp enzyme